MTMRRVGSIDRIVLGLRARIERWATSPDEGASLVEYALLVGLIAIVCVVALAFLGDSASESFSSTGSLVGAA